MAVLLVVAVAGYGQGGGKWPADARFAPLWDGRAVDPHCRKVNGCAGERPLGKEGGGPKVLLSPGGVKEAGTESQAKPQDEHSLAAGSKTSVAHPLVVHRSLVGNNLDVFTPSDPSMGISRNGFIVSADNFTIDFYSDVPDTLLQFQLHSDFYQDSSLIGVPFDPRVVYDRYANRFIVLTLAYADSADDYLLLSFSKAEDPRGGWNHYRIRSDSLVDGQWFDFPHLAVNKEEVFITGNLIPDSSRIIVGNAVFQIHKSEGYAGQPLVFKVWDNVRDAQGDIGYSLCPLPDGLMRDSYSRGIYLASTKPLYNGQSHDRLYWYQITDSFGGPNLQLDTHSVHAMVPYRDPPNGLQLGNNFPIRLGDAKVKSGFVMDSVLNFVYCRNRGNYGEVVLNRLDLRNNTLQRYPLGDSAGQQDFAFPSIAFMGADSTDPDNMAMGFHKLSTSIYPQLHAIHFDDGSFHVGSTLVRNGDGPVNFYGGSQSERLGDYTTIQRRYDAAPSRAWLVGGYPNGANPNGFGRSFLYNSFIAELGDSLALGAPGGAVASSPKVVLWPNPATEVVWLKSIHEDPRILAVCLVDMQGRQYFPDSHRFDAKSVEVLLEGLASGLYFARIQWSGNQVTHEKFVVLPSR